MAFATADHWKTVVSGTSVALFAGAESRGASVGQFVAATTVPLKTL